MKRLLKGLAVSLAVLITLAVLAEVGLRLADFEPIQNPNGPRYQYQADPELGYSLRPGFEGRHVHPEFDVGVRIDERGLRDLPLAGSPAARVLVLGDSMVFGYGVEAEETFCEVLQRTLGDVDVVNAGVSGYGPREQVAMLDRYVDELEPDLILSSFFFVNDLQDLIDPSETVLGGLTFTPSFAAQIESSVVRRLAVRYSQLLLTLETKRVELAAGMRIARPLDGITIPGPDDARAIAGLDLFAVPTPADLEQGWALVRAQYAALAARAGDRPLAVLYMPTLDELTATRWEAQLARHGLDPATVDRNRPFERLSAICADLGLELIDPRPGLRAAEDTWELYFPFNQHLTAEGNRLMAETLAPTIEALIRP